ncbi:ATP dependent DNA ligase domain-containing protein, partial [Lipomyces arxii]|uniref:ATP dependent DNA ligase domain-containing protein n=1 Tax=Lipomyces arxii TaxID=56418 RepID=UPI0034CDE6C2
SELLRQILVRLNSSEIKWLVRMFEKDMQSVNLLLQDCLESLHFALPTVWAFHNDIRITVTSLFVLPFDVFSQMPVPELTKRAEYTEGVLKWLTPTVGVPVRIPQSYKARRFGDVQSVLNHDDAWAEVKYDGERMQIHVSVDPPSISIFSKSVRDSTADRASVHERVAEDKYRRFSNTVIVKAELVVFDEHAGRIAGFHRIPDHVTRSGVQINAQNSDARRHEHLMAVFFDILMVDSTSLINLPYDYRRRRLEEVVTKISGYSALALRWRVNLANLNTLKDAYKVAVENGEEGIVVKRTGSTYIGGIKLKKDYISRLGDVADFAIVGAGIEIARKSADETISEQRKRNDLFVGCLTNKEAVIKFSAIPQFEVVFTVKYGLTKQNLARLDEIIKFSSRIFDRKVSACTVHMYIQCKMSVYFPEPLVFELLCAGFDKPAGNKFYVMQWPRMTKLHFDRDWRDATLLSELQEMAAMSVRQDESDASKGDEYLRKWKRGKHSNRLDIGGILRTSSPSPHSAQSSPFPSQNSGKSGKIRIKKISGTSGYHANKHLYILKKTRVSQTCLASHAKVCKCY